MKVTELGEHGNKKWELRTLLASAGWSHFYIVQVGAEDPYAASYYLSHNGSKFAESTDLRELADRLPSLLKAAAAIIAPPDV